MNHLSEIYLNPLVAMTKCGYADRVPRPKSYRHGMTSSGRAAGIR
jgi:hypothetical protein